MGLVGSKCGGASACAGGKAPPRGAERFSSPPRQTSEEYTAVTPAAAPSLPRAIEERRSSAASAPRALLLDRGSEGGHTLRDLLRAHIAAQLRALGPEANIAAPGGCDEDLWIDIHVVDFCNEVDALWRRVEAAGGAKWARRETPFERPGARRDVRDPQPKRPRGRPGVRGPRRPRQGPGRRAQSADGRGDSLSRQP